MHLNVIVFFQETLCLSAGTDKAKSEVKGTCVCHYKTENFHSQYFGPHCDIPGSVWKVPRKKRKGKRLLFELNNILFFLRLINLFYD
jgi:hypothetical protein